MCGEKKAVTALLYTGSPGDRTVSRRTSRHSSKVICRTGSGQRAPSLYALPRFKAYISPTPSRHRHSATPSIDISPIHRENKLVHRLKHPLPAVGGAEQPHLVLEHNTLAEVDDATNVAGEARGNYRACIEQAVGGSV